MRLLHTEIEDDDWTSRIIVMGDNMIDLPMPVVDLRDPDTSVQFHWTNSILLRQHNICPRAVIYFWPPHARLIEYTGYLEYINRGIYDISYYDDRIVFDKKIREDVNFSKEWINRPINSLVHSKFLSKSCQMMWTCPVLNYYDDSWGYDSVDIVQDIQNKLC